MSKLQNINQECTDHSSPFAPQKVHQSKPYLTTREAAALLGFAPITLVTWRHASKGPHFIRVGRMIRYRRSDLDAFMTSHLSGLGGPNRIVLNAGWKPIDPIKSKEVKQ